MLVHKESNGDAGDQADRVSEEDGLCQVLRVLWCAVGHLACVVVQIEACGCLERRANKQCCAAIVNQISLVVGGGRERVSGVGNPDKLKNFVNDDNRGCGLELASQFLALLVSGRVRVAIVSNFKRLLVFHYSIVVF